MIPLIQIRMGFPAETFALAVMPLLSGLADHWSLKCPTTVDRVGKSCSPVTDSLQLALRALDIRRERILPPNVPPEVLGALAPRWTYGVLVASLFRAIRDSDPDEAWTLLEAALPRDARTWLEEDPAVWAALTGSLVGPMASANPINDIVDVAARVVSPSSKASFEGHVPKGLQQPESLRVSDLEDRSSKSSEHETAETPPGLAGDFIDWLRSGLREQSLPLNTREALVHSVPEGLLLVSPGLFRAFLKRASLEVTSTVDPLKFLQREVLKLGWHLQSEGGLNLQTFEWKSGPRVGTKVHGVVITRTERLLSTAQPMNAALIRAGLH